MNDLCADIGYKSINHVGEQLCGDHVDIVEQNDGSTVIVLADGLGSGVKASILSTLTSKIISTMLAAGLPIEECVAAIAATPAFFSCSTIYFTAWGKPRRIPATVSRSPFSVWVIMGVKLAALPT